MSSTTKTTIPDPTPEEVALMNMARDGLMTSYLDEAGYEVTKTETGWTDSQEYAQSQARIDTLQKRVDDLTEVAKTSPHGGAGAFKISGSALFQAQNELSQAQRDQDKLQKDFKPEINYATRKKDDLETERIRAEYGEDSPEYKAQKAKYDASQEAMQKQQANVQVLTMNAAEKFLKGDYSISEDQRKFIDETLGPIKEAGLNAIKYLKDEAGLSEGKLQAAADEISGTYKETEKSLRSELLSYKGEILKTGDAMTKALEGFRDEVKRTGMQMGDAIVELENRTRTTGGNMKAALEESIKYSEALTKMGIQDFSLNTRNAIANQAAALGRSPTDPEFVQQMQRDVGREIQRTGLSFGQMAAQGRMGIEERTGAGLEEAARLRMGIAERTGAGMEEAARTGMGIAERTGAGMEEAAKMGMSIAERTGAGMENVAQTRLGIAERTAGLREEAARMQGRVEVGAAESAANMRTQLGMNQVPGQIGLGLNIGQYNQAVEQLRLSNAQAAMVAPMPLLDYGFRERAAEPTTKTSMGFGSIMGGIIGAGASGVGAAGALGWQPFRSSSSAPM